MDENNEFHFSDFNWPPLKRPQGHVSIVNTAGYVLDLIKDIVEEDGYVKIPRSELYRRSFSKLKGAVTLDKYLVLLHDNGYIYFNFRPKSNQKWYVVLNPHLANTSVNLYR